MESPCFDIRRSASLCHCCARCRLSKCACLIVISVSRASHRCYSSRGPHGEQLNVQSPPVITGWSFSGDNGFFPADTILLSNSWCPNFFKKKVCLDSLSAVSLFPKKRTLFELLLCWNCSVSPAAGRHSCPLRSDAAWTESSVVVVLKLHRVCVFKKCAEQRYSSRQARCKRRSRWVVCVCVLEGNGGRRGWAGQLMFRGEEEGKGVVYKTIMVNGPWWGAGSKRYKLLCSCFHTDTPLVHYQGTSDSPCSNREQLKFRQSLWILLNLATKSLWLFCNFVVSSFTNSSSSH